MTRRPDCPCSRWSCKGRGLYARPEGSFKRRSDLWEGNKCGAIFYAPTIDTGRSYRSERYPVKAILLNPNDLPNTVTDAVLDLPELTDDLKAALLDRFPDAEDTIDHLAAAIDEDTDDTQEDNQDV